MALGWRILGTGGAVLAGFAARKAITSGWQAATGNPPPTNPESPDTTWAEAVAWAVLSGAVIGTARMLATRKAAEYYRHSTGHLPPKMREVS
ncbi:MAG TPA: DUF4235 domain-containing protein [Actinomycetales bacterium]|nr:DUF4235 domain-containing protein [Actinomycetales bacterium]